jgi:hypothetical protein
MDIKELRIGNFIQSHSFVCVTSLDGHFINGYNIGSFAPILLTEETILKCGFGEVGMYKNVYHKDNFRIVTGKKGKDCLFQIFEDEDYVAIEISSVHQLQNLYFALTGKELEVHL